MPKTHMGWAKRTIEKERKEQEEKKAKQEFKEQLAATLRECPPMARPGMLAAMANNMAAVVGKGVPGTVQVRAPGITITSPRQLSSPSAASAGKGSGGITITPPAHYKHPSAASTSTGKGPDGGKGKGDDEWEGPECGDANTADDWWEGAEGGKGKGADVWWEGYDSWGSGTASWWKGAEHAMWGGWEGADGKGSNYGKASYGKASEGIDAKGVKGDRGGKGGKAYDGRPRPPSGPNLPRERVVESTVYGEVIEWRGKYGWLTPAEPIEHPLAKKHGGRIYVADKDLKNAPSLTAGQTCAFYVYADASGLGAEEVLAC